MKPSKYIKQWEKDRSAYEYLIFDERLEELDKLFISKERLDNLQFNYNKVFNDRLKLKKELSDLRKSFKEACRCCDRVKEKEKELGDLKEKFQEYCGALPKEQKEVKKK